MVTLKSLLFTVSTHYLLCMPTGSVTILLPCKFTLKVYVTVFLRCHMDFHHCTWHSRFCALLLIDNKHPLHLCVFPLHMLLRIIHTYVLDLSMLHFENYNMQYYPVNMNTGEY